VPMLPISMRSLSRDLDSLPRFLTLVSSLETKRHFYRMRDGCSPAHPAREMPQNRFCPILKSSFQARNGVVAPPFFRAESSRACFSKPYSRSAGAHNTSGLVISETTSRRQDNPLKAHNIWGRKLIYAQFFVLEGTKIH